MSNTPPSSAPGSSDESRWKRWGKTAFDKSIVVSDWASGYANSASAKIGGERFWPKSNDFLEEIAKCERILRAFTVEGVETKETKEDSSTSGSPEPSIHDGQASADDVGTEEGKKKDNLLKKKGKVLRKIPPSVIKRAKGIVIYTAMRSGIAPFGGAGGAGLMFARLPDGSWSAPSAITPNNLAVGLLLGFDIFDVILVINSSIAMESFKLHKVTLGAETAVAAGPFGTGISGELGVDRKPVFSYVRSRGLYGGVEAMAQAFLHRFDENERVYYWPGITARNILDGKVRKPPEVEPLYRALRDAESGVAQGDSLERWVYEPVQAPPNVAVRQLQKLDTVNLLDDGERLKLPPTPEELVAMEQAGIPDEFDLEEQRKSKQERLRREEQERAEIRALPPPPRHRNVVQYWEGRGSLPGGKRRVAPSPLQTEFTAVGETVEQKNEPSGRAEAEMEEVSLADEIADPPSLPPRRPISVDRLADEMDRSSINGAAKYGPSLDEKEPTSLDEAKSTSPVEHTTDDSAQAISAASTAHLISESPESLSRQASLNRPSRPPRRLPASASTVTLPPATVETTSHSYPGLHLFFDWDETITSHDTLSLIAPPEGLQAHGPSFSHYTEAYLTDLASFESSFGPRDDWAAQLKFLGAIDKVETDSVARVEEGGLFKDMTKSSLLSRAESQVQFRDGWDAFYTHLCSQVEGGKVAADVISVGWSGEFIKHAITSRSKSASLMGISGVYANEVEMTQDGRGTGRLTKSFALKLPNEEGGGKGGIRTAMDKLSIMKSLTEANKDVVNVYVGDSTTDLPCLVSAHYGLIMKPKASWEESSVQKTIQQTEPPVKELYTEHDEFIKHLVEAEEKDAHQENKQGGVLIRVEDWTQVQEVIRTIQERVIKQSS